MGQVVPQNSKLISAWNKRPYTWNKRPSGEKIVVLLSYLRDILMGSPSRICRGFCLFSSIQKGDIQTLGVLGEGLGQHIDVTVHQSGH